MKKLFALIPVLAALIFLTGCGGGGNDIYIYCSKREIETDFPKMVEEWKAEYQAQTGKELNVKLFVGNDDADTLLKTDMGNANVKEQPTIYYIDMTKLPDYVASGQALQLNTDAVKAMHSDFYNDLVMPIGVGENLTSDGTNSYGIPINYEGYGYYINEDTVAELFDETGDAIFEDLKMSSFEEFAAFVEAVTAWIEAPMTTEVVLNGNAHTLAAAKTATTEKLNAAFSMAGPEGWTWGFHLYNKSLNLEMATAFDAANTSEIEWTGAESYLNTMKFMFDHMADPTPDEKEITKATYGSELATEAYSYNASLATFAQGKALMIKQGNWAYTGIAESATPEFLKKMFFIPVKYDLDTPAVNAMSDADWKALGQIKGSNKAEKMDNFNKSITIFVPNYFVINAKADEKKQELAMEFLHWMQTSQTGLDYIVNTYAFIPYYQIPSDVDVTIDNAISKSIVEYAGRGLTLSNTMSGVPGGVHNDMQEWITETYLAPSDASQAGFKDFADFEEKIVKRFVEEWKVRAAQRDSVK